MKKMVIIGGGASGLVAAINAVKNNNEVLILEKNSSCGKKILMTGNGKCNYYNDDQNLKHYHSSNKELLSNFINENNCKKVLDFFDSIGIIPDIKDNYYYPKSNQAISIKNALVLEATNLGVKFKHNTIVKDIIKNEKYKIITEDDEIIADIVILATGSKACPKSGSDGSGYELAQKLGHNIIKPLPGLVQLNSNDKLKEACGVRTKVELSLHQNNELIRKESGELQITDYGLSGICTMQLSSYISKGLNSGFKEEIIIDFLPWINEDIIDWLESRNNKLKGRSVSQLLDGILNYKLVNAILIKSKINQDEIWCNLTENKKKILGYNLKKYKMNIESTKDFDNAQICVGGISIKEIDNNFESKINKNLFLIGELLDVNGDCGGYNLTFAWLSGLIAGKKAGEFND